MQFYNTLKEDNYIDYALMMYVSEEYYEDGNDIVRNSFKANDKNIFRKIWDKFVKFIRWIIDSVSKFFKKIKSWIMGSTNDTPKEKHREPYGAEIAPPDITFQNSSEPVTQTVSDTSPKPKPMPKNPIITQKPKSNMSDTYYFDTKYSDYTLKEVSKTLADALDNFMDFFNRFKSEISELNSGSNPDYIYEKIYKKSINEFNESINMVKDDANIEINIKLTKDNYDNEWGGINKIISNDFSNNFEKRLKKISSLIERSKSVIENIDSSEVKNYEIIKRVVNESSNFISELTKIVTNIIRNTVIEWTKFRQEVYAN